MSKVLLLICTACLLIACQSTPINNAKQDPPHIRRAGPITFSHHEHRAEKFPQHYIIEGQNNNKTVALTFDDGPSEYSQGVLDTLAKYGIKATFFTLGAAIEKNPKQLKAMYDAGHEIGNHSWDHDNMNNYPNLTDFWQKQIENQMAITKKHLGVTPLFFRPPFGSISDEQVQFLADKGIVTFIWSIDTIDWDESNNAVDTLVKAATQYMHPEAIILMHDGGGNRQNTVKSLDAIVKKYRNAGYKFVTLSTMLNKPAYR